MNQCIIDNNIIEMNMYIYLSVSDLGKADIYWVEMLAQIFDVYVLCHGSVHEASAIQV